MNRCDDCKHTWVPKGHNLSKKCPYCGSNRVRIYRNEFRFLIAVLGAITFIASLAGLLFDSTSLRDWALKNSGTVDIMTAVLGLLLGVAVVRRFFKAKE